MLKQLLNALNIVLRPSGYELRQYRNYIDIGAARKNAQRRGQPLIPYLEQLWGIQGCREFVMEKLDALGAHVPCREMVEIGPGAGIFLEMHMQRVSPERYHIFETDRGCRNYLSQTYRVVPHNADGRSLTGLDDSSCGLCVAHQVFVYLSLINCFLYFEEMVRVCATGGYIAFDYYSDVELDMQCVASWMGARVLYPVVLPEKLIVEYFSSRNCVLVGRFMTETGSGDTLYMVFKKNAATV